MAWRASPGTRVSGQALSLEFTAVPADMTQASLCVLGTAWPPNGMRANGGRRSSMPATRPADMLLLRCDSGQPPNCDGCRAPADSDRLLNSRMRNSKPNNPGITPKRRALPP